MEQIELYERLIKAYDRIKELEERVDLLKWQLRNAEIGTGSAAETLKKENSALRAEIDSLKESEKPPFLRSWLTSKGINYRDAAALCGLSESTMSRACNGYRLKRPSVAKIVSGLGLSDEEAEEMYKQTRRKK